MVHKVHYSISILIAPTCKVLQLQHQNPVVVVINTVNLEQKPLFLTHTALSNKSERSTIGLMKIKTILLPLIISICLINTAYADYSCNILTSPDASSICNERVEFSKKINSPIDKSEFGLISSLLGYDQSNKLKEVVKSGDYLNASKLFNDHKDEYFLKKPAFGGKVRFYEHYNLFFKIAHNLNANYQIESDELEKLLIILSSKLKKSTITKVEGLNSLNRIVEFKERLKLDYRSHQILSEFKEPVFDDIENLISKTRELLKKYKKSITIPFFSSDSDDVSSSSSSIGWSKFVGYVFFGMIIFVVIWLSSNNKSSPPPPAPKDDKERQSLLSLWKKRVKRIKRANSILANYLSNETGYFSNYQSNYWLGQHKKLFNEIQGQSYGRIGLDSADINVIKKFIKNYKKIPNLRKEFNISFVESELKTYSDFFNNIEDGENFVELDEQQRKAVVTDEDNNLIIAGAGSGKTTTIVGKVNYILDKYKVNPKEVLLISYTKASSNDLGKRIGVKNIDVKTFHKFGLDVLADIEGRKSSIFDSVNKFTPLLTKIFKTLLKDSNYIKQVNTFTTEYLQQPKSQFDFESRGQYYQYLRDQNFKTFQVIETISKITGLRTIKREVVKSVEECKIANFLLFNGVEYKYEEPYEYDTANMRHTQYKPDFSIFQDGKRIYLEHFGINKNKQVPPFFAKDGETHEQATTRYIKDMKWKIGLHKANSTQLVETYSYEMWRNNDIFYDNLKERLIAAGIKLKPKTPKEIWEIINKYYQNEEKEIIKLFGTFITLMKSNQYSITTVRKKAGKIADGFLRKRNLLFLDIINPIYDKYEEHLIKKKVIDFSDMINKATDYIAKGKYKRKISYVIIDEFQDISIGRYNLVKALKTSNSGCKLFCVGDDWQSIYRFSGSDIALFKNFSDYFGVTEKLKIETTYRFHNPLIDLSSRFIQQNPNQAKKDLRSADSSMRTNYHIRYSGNDDTDTLIDIFSELIGTYEDIAEKKITILARHNRDFEKRVKNENNLLSINTKDNTIYYQIQTEEGEKKEVKANFQSIHSSKGLEADIIIIINCNSGRLGLPNQMADDHSLNLLLSEADQYENGEERRLFYVAMTRAKEVLYFVTDRYNKSKFILEIESDDKQVSGIKCPVCKDGDILPKTRGEARRTGDRYVFYGCSNYEYGCKHKYSVYESQTALWVEDDY